MAGRETRVLNRWMASFGRSGLSKRCRKMPCRVSVMPSAVATPIHQPTPSQLKIQAASAISHSSAKNAGHAVEPAVVHVAGQRRDPDVLGNFLGAPAFKLPSIVGSHRRHLLPERLDILGEMRYQRGVKLIPVECRSGVQQYSSSLGNITKF